MIVALAKFPRGAIATFAFIAAAACLAVPTARAAEPSRPPLPFPLINQTVVAESAPDHGDVAGPAAQAENPIAVARAGDFTAHLGIEAPRRAGTHSLCPQGVVCPAALAADLARWMQGAQGTQGGLTVTLAPREWLEFSPAAVPTQSDDEAPRAAPVVATPPAPQPASRQAPSVQSAPPEPPASAAPAQSEPPPVADVPLPGGTTPWLAGGAAALAVLCAPLWLWQRRQRAQAVTARLNDFYNRVDLAKQQHAHHAQAFDEQVQKAFEQLHQDIRQLLQTRQISMADLKKRVLWFHAPQPQGGARWTPPTLSQMGYVLGAADRFRADAAVLALYKYSGEESIAGAQVVDTYTIVKEGSSDGFSTAFAAKIRSPYAIALRTGSAANSPAEENTPTAPAPAPAPAAAPAVAPEIDESQSERNVTYVLSLASRADDNTRRRIQANLAALAQAPTSPAQAAPSTLPAHWSLRSLLSEDLSRHEAELRAGHGALQREPHLLVAALADLRRQQVIDAPQLDDLLINMNTALGAVSAPVRQERAARMRALTQALQALPALTARQPLRNPGVTYVDARGAETDAGFLQRVAQLAASARPAQAQGAAIVMASHFTKAELRANLTGYAELIPGEENLTALSSLVAALDAGTLALHQVEGAQPLKVAEILQGHNASASQYLVFATDLALAILNGMPPSLHYVLWTLTSEALIVEAAVRDQLINDSRALRAYGRMRRAGHAPPAG